MSEPSGAGLLRRPLSQVGLLLGTLFLAFSLTPSLLPRPAVAQVLSGWSLAAGYGLGVAAMGLWRYLQLPMVSARTARLGAAVAALVCLLIAASFLWQASGWQDAIHALMGMEPPGGARLSTLNQSVMGLGRLIM